MGLKNWLLDKKVQGLLKGLESPNLEVQKKNALAILEIKDEIIDEIINNFNNLNITGKRNVVVVFGKTMDSRVVPLLIALLEHKDPVLRDKVISSLLALGKDLVAMKLLEIMAFKDRDFHLEALKVLNKIRLEDIPKEKKIYYYIARDEYHECIDIGEPAVEILLKALDDHKENPDRKRSIVIALGKLGSTRATPYLLHLLDDNDKYVRERTIEALGKIGDINAIPALISNLEDQNSWVRKAAAKALEELKWIPENKTDEANYYLAKKDFKRCIDIGKSAVSGMMNLLNNEKHDTETIKEILYALGKIGDIRSINTLVNSLRDNDKSIKNCAARALIDMGQVVSGFILKELNDTKDDRTKDAIIKILGEIGDEQAAITLIELLHKEKSDLKAVAAQALGKIKSRDAVRPLLLLIQDKEAGKHAVENAIFALGEIGDISAVEPLMDIMKGAQSAMKVKSFAAQALGKIGDERAVEVLIENTKEKACGIACVEALGIIASPDAAEALYQIMSGETDSSTDIRLASIKALEAIGGEEIQAILYASIEDINNEKLKKAIFTSLGNLGLHITDVPMSDVPVKTSKKRKLRGQLRGR